MISTWQKYMDSDFWLDLVGGRDGLVLLALIALSSFFAGYFMKRYARLVVIFVTLIFVISIIGVHAGLVTFHWESMCRLMGGPAASSAVYSPEYLACLAREQSICLVVGLVSFIIGHIAG